MSAPSPPNPPTPPSPSEPSSRPEASSRPDPPGLASAASGRTALDRAAVAVPVAAVVLLAVTWGRSLPGWMVAVVAVFLAGSVLVAVHHAEVVAHRVGEPFGSLLLAVAVTVIEVALIVTMMSANGTKSATLARDTVFAAVMITCNGIVGLCLLVVALRRRLAYFNAEGTGTAFATIIALAGLSLVLPTFTTSKPGPEFSTAQLTFAALASICLYGLFITALTVRHRPDFLPVDRRAAAAGPGPGSGLGSGSESGLGAGSGGATGAGPASASPPTDRDEEDHGEPPTTRAALASLGFLGLALLAVVGLSKGVSPTIESGVAAAHLPASVASVVIALLVLLPESIAALRSARRDHVQTSLNLALGSAMASIGLTIPTIALASVWLSGPLILGLGASHMVLLAMTAAVGTLTFVPGRATLVQGGVHLALMAAYLVLAVSP